MDFKLNTEGSIEIATTDGNFSSKIGGRFLADAAFYNEEKNPLGDGTEIRQAQLGFTGTILKDWEYSLGFEFGQAKVDIKDAYANYKGFSPFNLKIGHFKTPFSIEQLNSRKYLTFLERSLPNAFAPDRKIGLDVGFNSKLFIAETALLGEYFSEDSENEGDEGWTSSTRLVFSPIHSDKKVIHLGSSFQYQAPKDEKIVKFAVNPESHITSVQYVDTGKIKNVENIYKYGLEAACVFGPFSLQGEYIYSALDRCDEQEDLDFSGWYAYGTWFITGESRNYDFKKTTFGKIKPAHKFGAVEVALRYSTIDLNDESLIKGGEEKNVTIALNWYINTYMRLMINYIFVNNDKNADFYGDVIGNDDIDILQARFQVEF
ncbi:porin [bacterium]|nr:porin [bacterium]